MSKPPVIPDKSLSGIAVDPRTLERVIPESKRPDGSVRKQLKIRPGFTPQEDVRRFRGTKQAQMDASALPKGHILGWTPPSTTKATPATGSNGASKPPPPNKNAKKRQRQREKKAVEGDQAPVKDNWEDDDDEEDEGSKSGTNGTGDVGTHTTEKPNWAAAPEERKADQQKDSSGADSLASELEKLKVQ